MSASIITGRSLTVLMVLLFAISIFSTAAGAGIFSDNKRVNDDTTTTQQYLPALAYDDSGRLHAVWLDSRSGGLELYYSRSDSGTAFGAGKKIGEIDVLEGVTAGPALAAGGAGNVYAAGFALSGDKYNLYLINSTDGGDTFGQEQVITDRKDVNQLAPVLGADGSERVFCAWMDDRGESWDIYFSSSSDSGATFGTDIKLNDDTGTGIQAYPALAVSAAGTIHVVWQDARDGDYDVYYTSSTDNGQTFSTNKPIAGGPGTNQTEPSITAGPGSELYVVYTDSTDIGSEVYIVASLDSGSTWGAPVSISQGPAGSAQKQPAVAADSSGKIYAAWADNRSYTEDNSFDIYCANSTDSGKSFGVAEKVNDDIGNSIHSWPDLAVSPVDILDVAWSDDRNGDFDIYIAATPTGSVLDSRPPVVVHVPVTGGTANRAHPITATITDNVQIVSALLYYRTVGESEYRSTPMTGTGDVYTGEIPGASVKTSGVEYYIYATDGLNTATHPASGAADTPHRISITSLNPPGFFNAEAGDGRVVLTWSKVDAAAGYNLYRAEGAETAFVKVNSAPITETTFRDNSVSNGITYHYYLKSVDGDGAESLGSETRSATPAAPDNDGSDGGQQSLYLIIAVIAILAVVAVVALLAVLRKRGAGDQE